MIRPCVSRQSGSVTGGETAQTIQTKDLTVVSHKWMLTIIFESIRISLNVMFYGSVAILKYVIKIMSNSVEDACCSSSDLESSII